MTLAEEIFQRSRDLPVEKAQEVLDFIEFIKDRPPGTQGASERGMNLEIRQQETRKLLDGFRIDFGGRPMTDREDANARR
ncbi:MAG: hypothetical protein HUU16_05745 [Candidatus Omnitrophica bacterium]|nr:hypothetical protein [bacterium]NUN95655.1 hypothetical protein [Candidatus Omnitrophota bacterium]